VKSLYAEKNKYYKKNIEKKLEDGEVDEDKRNDTKPEEIDDASGGNTEVRLSAEFFEELLPEEREIFRVLVTDKESFKVIHNIKDFSEDVFFSIPGKYLISFLLEYNKEGSTLNEILSDELVHPEIKDILSASAFKEEISSGWEKMGVKVRGGESDRIITDSLTKIEIRKMNEKIKSLKGMLKSSDGEGITNIIKNLTELENQKREKTNSLGSS
jgi:hypothetical protein